MKKFNKVLILTKIFIKFSLMLLYKKGLKLPTWTFILSSPSPNTRHMHVSSHTSLLTYSYWAFISWKILIWNYIHSQAHNNLKKEIHAYICTHIFMCGEINEKRNFRKKNMNHDEKNKNIKNAYIFMNFCFINF